MNKKLKAINSISISEWSNSGNELEYILCNNTEENRSLLLNAGFTMEEIENALTIDKKQIDISTLAFAYAGAEYWTKDNGFVDTPQKCRICGCTENHACPNGCYWVESDLCSACESKINEPSNTITAEPEKLLCAYCDQELLIHHIEPHAHHVVELPDYKGGWFAECLNCTCSLSADSKEKLILACKRRPAKINVYMEKSDVKLLETKGGHAK